MAQEEDKPPRMETGDDHRQHHQPEGELLLAQQPDTPQVVQVQDQPLTGEDERETRELSVTGESFSEQESPDTSVSLSLSDSHQETQLHSSRKGSRPRFNSPGQGRKISYSKELDLEIAQYVKDTLEQGKKMTVQMLCNYSKEKIHEENPQFNASTGWAQRFLARHGIDLSEKQRKANSNGSTQFKSDTARTSERGRPLSYSFKTDQTLADWVRAKQAEGELVSNSELRKHAKDLILKENPNFTGSASWAQNFLLRHKLCLHIGFPSFEQKDLPLDSSSPVIGAGLSMLTDDSPLQPISHHHHHHQHHHQQQQSGMVYADPTVPPGPPTLGGMFGGEVPGADESMKAALALLTSENIDAALLNPAQAAAIQSTLNELASDSLSLVDLLNNAQQLQAATEGGEGLIGHGIETSSAASLFMGLPAPTDALSIPLSSSTAMQHQHQHLVTSSMHMPTTSPQDGSGPAITSASRPLSYARETDQNLAKWVQKQQSQGKKVTFSSLRAYAKKLVSSENPNFNASVGWVTPFLLRHNLDLSVNKKKKEPRKVVEPGKISSSPNEEGGDDSLLQESFSPSSMQTEEPMDATCSSTTIQEPLTVSQQQQQQQQSLPIQVTMSEVGSMTDDPTSLVDGPSAAEETVVPVVLCSGEPGTGGVSVSPTATQPSHSGEATAPQALDSAHPPPERKYVARKHKSTLRSRHTLAEKLEVVKLMKELNVTGHYVCRVLGIANSTIAGWIKLVQQKGPELEALSINKKRANVSGQGRPLSYSKEKDEAIARWVRAQQQLGCQVTSSDLAKYATSLIGEENVNFTASTGWQQKFLQRHNLLLTPKNSVGDGGNSSRVTVLEDQQSIPAAVQTEEVVTHEVAASSILEKHSHSEFDEQLTQWVREKLVENKSISVQQFCQHAEEVVRVTSPSFRATLGWAFKFLHSNKLFLDPRLPSTFTATGTTPEVSRKRPFEAIEIQQEALSTPPKTVCVASPLPPPPPSSLPPQAAMEVAVSPSTGNLCEALLALSREAQAEDGDNPDVRAAVQAVETAVQQAQAILHQQESAIMPVLDQDTYFGKPARKFSSEEKEQVVRYANATTLQKAAIRYGVAAPTVWRWRVELKLHQPKYTAMQKKYIIKYAENNSLKEAAVRYGITTKTIQNWRKALHSEGLISDEGSLVNIPAQELGQEGMEEEEGGGGGGGGGSGAAEMVAYDGNFQFVVDGGEVLELDAGTREQHGSTSSSVGNAEGRASTGGGEAGEGGPITVQQLEVTNEMDIENVGMEYDVVSSEGHSAKPRCTLQEKKLILQYALDHSIKEASQKYGISPGTLYYWKKNLANLCDAEEQLHVQGIGSNPEDPKSSTANSSSSNNLSLSGVPSRESTCVVNIPYPQEEGVGGRGGSVDHGSKVSTTDASCGAGTSAPEPTDSLSASEALFSIGGGGGVSSETVQILTQTLASMSPETIQNLPHDFNLLQAVSSLLNSSEAAASVSAMAGGGGVGAVRETTHSGGGGGKRQKQSFTQRLGSTSEGISSPTEVLVQFPSRVAPSNSSDRSVAVTTGEEEEKEGDVEPSSSAVNPPIEEGGGGGGGGDMMVPVSVAMVQEGGGHSEVASSSSPSSSMLPATDQDSSVSVGVPVTLRNVLPTDMVISTLTGHT